MLRRHSDKRAAARKRMLKGGIITFGGRQMTQGCVVRDISSSGARLQVRHPIGVPDTFELIIELDGIEVPCEVVRRGASEIGVRFVARVDRVAPKRVQVVEMSAQTTLRRTPVPPAPAVEAASVAAAPAARAKAPSHVPIVIAEDDPDDRLMMESVFKDTNFPHPYAFVQDGEQLLRYLRGQAPFEARRTPGLVLLDLNMPRMDGRTALMNIKTDSALRRLPVIVLTTSNAEEDIDRTYELGVSAFIQKPNSLDGMLEIATAIDQYWTRMVRLPRSGQARTA
jgi:CheY-like chemotaxis protein